MQELVVLSEILQILQALLVKFFNRLDQELYGHLLLLVEQT
jgi:hypothetical protein